MSCVDYVPGCQRDGMAWVVNLRQCFLTAVLKNHCVCSSCPGACRMMLDEVVMGAVMELYLGIFESQPIDFSRLQ